MSLANDDLGAAKDASARLADDIRAIDMELFSGAAHMKWMQISQKLLTAADSAAKASDIVAARDAFFHLSESVIALHDAFGHAMNCQKNAQGAEDVPVHPRLLLRDHESVQ